MELFYLEVIPPQKVSIENQNFRAISVNKLSELTVEGHETNKG